MEIFGLYVYNEGVAYILDEEELVFHLLRPSTTLLDGIDLCSQDIAADGSSLAV